MVEILEEVEHPYPSEMITSGSMILNKVVSIPVMTILVFPAEEDVPTS